MMFLNRCSTWFAQTRFTSCIRLSSLSTLASSASASAPLAAADVECDESKQNGEEGESEKRKPLTEAERKARSAERARQWYWANREQVLQRKKQLYEEEREHILLERKEQYSVKRDEILKKRHEYYHQHRDVLLLRRKLYYERNRDDVIKRNQERTAYNRFIESDSPDMLQFQMRTDGVEGDDASGPQLFSRDRALSSLELCAKTVSLLLDVKAQDVCAFDIRTISPKMAHLTEYVVIVTGTSGRHLNAITQEVVSGHADTRMQPDNTAVPVHVEGNPEDGWICLDLGPGVVLVHVLVPDLRQRYDLDRKWALMT
ncbi:mitochondrial assembly-of-ribosomal-large-subunit protein [Andalucia godoyi]|uniref:Mitochondrial assembly-of-ribosomal-large-subunit protein n=1 Tax=Andalucia godoyi TaxID=505711 RepID=A0A8K0F4M4_ANDGO|nr:mitochondrial assembly-of-ribosomal-large-subunit protein [Andalucia godoyi]|eukprot:ANDGO_03827.mRNA.1 mitochondrial assembly-of-ribosomal-large-subunit protein (C7orf30/IOJAP homolog)